MRRVIREVVQMLQHVYPEHQFQVVGLIAALSFVKYFSINFGCINGYVQFSGKSSISTTFSISLCNSFANSVISAKQSSPNVSSPVSFTMVLPVTEYTHIGFISNLIAPVSSCNSLLAVSKISSPASLCPPGTSYVSLSLCLQNTHLPLLCEITTANFNSSSLTVS